MQSDFVVKKTLIASKLGLDGEYNKNELYRKAIKGLHSLDISNEIKLFCIHILDKSYQGEKEFLTYDYTFSPKPNILTDTDIKIITSDIGEIASALYVLSTFPYLKDAKVNFMPPNEMLIDYKINNINFSSKTGSGAKNSLISIRQALFQKKLNSWLNHNEFIASEIIQQLLTEFLPNYFCVINSAKILGCDGVKWLSNKFNTEKWERDPEELMNMLSNIDSYDSLINEFGEYFKLCDFTPNKVVVERLLNNPRKGKDKPWGILHFPLTSYIVKWLNNSYEARKILTECANTLLINQIYLDVTSKGFKYTIREFSNAYFTFGTPSSTARPTKNRIGFKMIKGIK